MLYEVITANLSSWKQNSASLPQDPNTHRPLQLPPNHRKLEFEFTALSFVAPENVHLIIILYCI